MFISKFLFGHKSSFLLSIDTPHLEFIFMNSVKYSTKLFFSQMDSSCSSITKQLILDPLVYIFASIIYRISL
jgi:hypothetical protein